MILEVYSSQPGRFIEARINDLLEAARETARQRTLAPQERRLERAMQTAFEEQERVLLRRLSTLRPWWPEPLPLREALAPSDWEPLFTAVEVATLRLFSEPLTLAARVAMRLGGRTALADLGLDLSFNVRHPEAVRYLQDIGANRVARINETTRKAVRETLVTATEQGWSYNRTAKELSDQFREFRVPRPQQHIRSRAHMIAVTEIGDAYVQGHMVVGRQLRDAGLPMEKRWLDVGDEREDSTCLSNASQGWIPFDSNFGSGHSGPTAHPACRCDIEQRVARGRR